MLRVNKVVLENFLSHKNTVLDINSREGLVLISGRNTSGLYDSNGAGKSTILEGIIYAITGDTLRGLSANDVVNRNSKKDTRVSLEFETESGRYIIDRYRKHTQYGDKIDLWDMSGTSPVNISKRINKETQILLDSIVNIPEDVLKNTILLGEGLSSRFTQLSDPAKKSLIESTLNLSYDMSKCKESASQELKSLKIDKSRREGQLVTLDSLLKDNIESLDDTIRGLELEISTKSALLIDLNAERDRVQEMIPAITSKIDIIRKSIEEYNTVYQNLVTLDTETALLVQEITKLESSESPECTLCHQKLESEDAREYVLSDYKSRIEKNTLQMKSWQSTLDNLPDVSILNTRLTELQNMLQEYQYSLNNIHANIVETTSIIERCRTTLENSISVKSNMSEYQAQSQEVRAILSTIDIDIWKYEYLYKVFSPTGIITYILEDAISYINERIKVYTDILLGKTYKLVLSKGKISLEDAGGSTYQSLSNGEKRRLDISIQFSLHDYTSIYCGISTNVLFLDEVLDTLDTTGVNNIIEVLSLKKEYCKLEGIYVITHNSELKSYFDDIITVTKDSVGNSQIS